MGDKILMCMNQLDLPRSHVEAVTETCEGCQGKVWRSKSSLGFKVTVICNRCTAKYVDKFGPPRNALIPNLEPIDPTFLAECYMLSQSREPVDEWLRQMMRDWTDDCMRNLDKNLVQSFPEYLKKRFALN